MTSAAAGTGPDAPSVLARFYDGVDLSQKASIAAYVVTLAADGWPHAAMISVGELLIKSADDVRLALWPHSHTTMNVRRSGRATLLVVLAAQAIRAHLALKPMPTVSDLAGLQAFAGRIVSATSDTAPYADITSAVTFQLSDVVESMQRWESTLAALQGGSSGPTS